MKKLLVCLTAVCVMTGWAFAAGGDPTETGVPTSPLKIWSTGVGGGLLYTKGDSVETFGKVVWLNSFDFTESFALFADVGWYMGDSGVVNFGLDLGGDYRFLSYSRVSPILGVGAGAHYFDRKSANADLGGSVFVRAGVALKLTKTMDVSVRVPFRYYVMNDNRAFGVGVEVGVLFFSSLRNVKSIDY